MADLIDRGKLRKDCLRFFPECSNVVDMVVDREPTVDAVPVIRCKDCRYACKWESGKKSEPDYLCSFRQYDDVEANDFCSYGELVEKPVEMEGKK